MKFNIFNDKLIKYSLILILFLVVVISSTLAYYSWGTIASQNTNVAFDIISDGVYIYYDGGPDIIGKDLFPTDNKTRDGIVKEITVRVDEYKADAKFNLYLDLKTLPNALKHASFKYELYQASTLKTSGNFTNSGVTCTTNNTNHIVLLSNVTPSTTTQTYTLYIWIDGQNFTNPDTMMNQEFEFTLHADGVKVKNPPTFPEMIGVTPVLDSTAGVNYSQTSEQNNTNGLYILNGTQNDANPIYYYRGNVNNNLLFANTCWKIIRTTETGGLRLIYNGVPSSGTCNNTGYDSTISSRKFNNGHLSPAYLGYMYGTIYEIASSRQVDAAGWKYAPDVTYSGGSYTLTSKGSYNVEVKSDVTGTNLNYHHYTCGSSTDTTCLTVKYVYAIYDDRIRYITLSNGKKVGDALSDMLDYNTTSSFIKGDGASAAEGTLDYWYRNNIDNNSAYKSLIDYNEIFCNDRSIYQIGGWNPDGGSTTDYNLEFGAYGRLIDQKSPSLTCSRDIDKFSVSTANVGNNDLTYPVGLITADEFVMAGAKWDTDNRNYYLYVGDYTEFQNWTSTPSNFDFAWAYSFMEYYNGSLRAADADYNMGVRPVIALKAGYEIGGGDGSTGSPYTVG